MLPEERVLVGVIKRKTDLKLMLDEHWYRIPQEQMPRGIHTEYLAFYLSSSAAKDQPNSGIYYYAERAGVELVRRRDLLPKEAHKTNADDVYYKVQLKHITPRIPAITNPSNRRFSFIFTTWDRFTDAEIIADLYSKEDYYVDRIYHALRDAHYQPSRFWTTEQQETGLKPQVRLLCENGVVIVAIDATQPYDVLLDEQETDKAILQQIKHAIKAKGGLISPMLKQE